MTLPRVLLLLLLALHLALAGWHTLARGGWPEPTNHLGVKNVVEQRRLMEGDALLGPRPHPGRAAFFLPPSRMPSSTSPPVPSGLSGLVRNHPDLRYWIETPHPFVFGALLAHLFPGAILPTGLWPCVYLAFLLIALYGLGTIASDEWTGLTAAAVASGYPAVFGFARLHHEALPLAAWSAMAVCALMASDGLRRPWPCLAAGGALFCAYRSGESLYGGVLAGLIVLGPLCLEVARGPWREARRWRTWVGPAALLLPGLLVDARWLMDSLLVVLRGFEDTGTAPEIPPAFAPVAEPLRLLAYVPTLAGDLLRPLPFTLAVVGAALLPRAVPGRRLAVALLALLPLAALSLMTRKADWYCAPMAPSLALVTALGLTGLPGRARGVAQLGAATLGVLSLLFHTLAPDTLRNPADTLAASLRAVAEMRRVSLVPPHTFEGVSALRAAEAVVGTVNDAPGSTPLVVALICPERSLAHAFRYVVEMSAPRARVVSLLDRSLLETNYQALPPEAVDLVVGLDTNGLVRWDPTPGAPAPAGFAAPRWPGVPDPFPGFLEVLRQTRQVREVDLGGGTVWWLDGR